MKETLLINNKNEEGKTLLTGNLGVRLMLDQENWLIRITIDV
jgi:hypothetical protein